MRPVFGEQVGGLFPSCSQKFSILSFAPHRTPSINPGSPPGRKLCKTKCEGIAGLNGNQSPDSRNACTAGSSNSILPESGEKEATSNRKMRERYFIRATKGSVDRARIN